MRMPIFNPNDLNLIYFDLSRLPGLKVYDELMNNLQFNDRVV